MRQIIECVPNFSEGRRKKVVDALAAALTAKPGTALLDTEMDASHNRCVITIAGGPEAVAEGVIEAVGKAAELIDLRLHKGEHPRMGAADVIPFIPISNASIQDCIDLSIKVARTIAERYQIPVYLYEQSARIPERQDLANVRRGQFEGIREEIRNNPERKPDFGPSEVHPSAGATAVGARYPLIAYNIYLRSSDLGIAREIARSVRSSNGGFPYVKALGFLIQERDQAQVSMNLTNYQATPLHRVFDLVSGEAERHGTSVASSEIVGLVPQQALDSAAGHYLRLENFSGNRVLENRLSEALATEPQMDEFIASVAEISPLLPGGGSVAALAGSLAAALGEMMSGLTEGRKKFEGVDTQVREIHARLSVLRERLWKSVREDARAFHSVMEALQLPKGTGEQQVARSDALEKATRTATEIPLSVARASMEALEHIRVLVQFGNPNALCDAAVGAQMAFAALKGAEYNVLANIRKLKDEVFARNCRAEVLDLTGRGRVILHEIDRAVTGA